MAIYQYNLLLAPKGPEVLSYEFSKDQEYEFWDHDFWKASHEYSEVMLELESYLPLIEWSKNTTDIRNLGDDDKNDVSISLINDTFIEHFHVRIDLREIDQEFIDFIIKIALKLDCYLIDRKGSSFSPTIEELKESISQSDAFKFVSGPKRFLGDFGSEHNSSN